MVVKERNISIAQLSGIIGLITLIASSTLYFSNIKAEGEKADISQDKDITAVQRDISDLKDSVKNINNDIRLMSSLIQRMAIKQGIDITSVAQIVKTEK